MSNPHPFDPKKPAPPRPIPYHKRLFGAVREAASYDGEGTPRLTWRPKDNRGMLVKKSVFFEFLDRVEAGDATAELREPSIGGGTVWVTWEVIRELEATAQAGGPVDEEDQVTDPVTLGS